MKQLFTVYEFELQSYIKNKAFVITTLIIALAVTALTFAPRFVDVSSITDSVTEEEEIVEDELTLGIIDDNGVIQDMSILEAYFPSTEFISYDNVDDMKKSVEEEKIDGAFLVKDDVTYEYYVLNMNMYDMNQYTFETVLTTIHKINYCEQNGIDYAKLTEEYDTPINSEQIIIGKAAEDNFWYCYALVMVIFFIIILYGTMIATSVTNEKSNRSIEVLVTTVDVKSLMFGKVLAGVTSAIVQVGLVLGLAVGGYAYNSQYWDGALDMIFDIPVSVLVVFAIFGIGGFTFFACLYAAMGALVSKTEDVNKSSSSLQMIIMIVYFASMYLMQFPDSIGMKVLSYLPFTSYSAMFVRMGLGKVETWEVVVSAVILYASIVGAGWIAAKIYRMGTLRYGNQIKITTALKEIINGGADK